VLLAQQVIKANGHSFGEWIVTVQPTEEKNGLKRRDCDNCDEFETEVVVSLLHDHSRWDEIVLDAVAPTCTTDGYTLHKCECGEEYSDTIVDAIGLVVYFKIATLLLDALK
jgi:hypothetical protein